MRASRLPSARTANGPALRERRLPGRPWRALPRRRLSAAPRDAISSWTRGAAFLVIRLRAVIGVCSPVLGMVSVDHWTIMSGAVPAAFLAIAADVGRGAPR